MKTYTDHPKYQESIKRSKCHNSIRFFFGLFICIFIALPLTTLSLLAIPYSIHETYQYFYDPAFHKNIAALYIFSPFISMTLVFAGITLFRWGRHLTRATSREFV